MKRKPAIIAYDIASPLRRRRVFKRLLAWRIDGQKSVHECLLNEREAEELYAELSDLIDSDADHLLLAWVVPGAELQGIGLGREDRLFQRFVRVA